MNQQFEMLQFLEDDIDKLQSALEWIERNPQIPIIISQTLQNTTRAALQGALEQYAAHKRALRKGEQTSTNGRS